LLAALQDAHDRNLLDADALSMMEGVLQVSELRALDLMVPRSQMDVIDLTEPPKSWLPQVVETAHSRFPVIEGNRDQVLGVLLAKELLRYYHDENFDVRTMVRPRFLFRRPSAQCACCVSSVPTATIWRS